MLLLTLLLFISLLLELLLLSLLTSSLILLLTTKKYTYLYRAFKFAMRCCNSHNALRREANPLQIFLAVAAIFCSSSTLRIKVDLKCRHSNFYNKSHSGAL